MKSIVLLALAKSDYDAMKKRRYEISRIDNTICAFNRADIVLDAGSGQGHNLEALSAKCNSVCAIDSTLRFLQNARSIIARENVILINADLSKVPIRSGYFDKIICLEVLEHSEAPLGIVSELHRILKPNGICVIAVPTYQSEALYSKLNPRYDRNRGEHITILRKKEWLSLFKGVGFALLGVRNENFGPALHWIFRSMFPIEYDPSSGVFSEYRLFDWLFIFGVPIANRATFGSVNKCGNKIFPKSWYFYLRKMR